MTYSQLIPALSPDHLDLQGAPERRCSGVQVVVSKLVYLKIFLISLGLGTLAGFRLEC